MSHLLASYRSQINQHYLTAESDMIPHLLSYLPDYDAAHIQQQARKLVNALRANKKRQTLIGAFLHEYQLNSAEGRILMSLAEALLRIPDIATQDLFLQEKLSTADWHKHLLQSDFLLVNVATQALAVSGKFEQTFNASDDEHQQIFSRLCQRLGLPLIRTAIKQAMQQLAYQFVMAESIENAMEKANQQHESLYSFDMLGESALTMADAERYFNAYAHAIEHIAQHARQQDMATIPGISIKLSALYPRYEALQHQQAIPALRQKLLQLCQQARSAHIGVTVDAEESERLELSLSIFQSVLTDDTLQGWSGFGLAVQAYQKRAISTLHWLLALAKSQHCIIPLRLVKGAYWDSEIKRAQVNGLTNYPVFTHKAATDVSYLACARFMLANPQHFYPQFATHNAHTIAAILSMSKQHPGYEFQRLFGMGELLYQQPFHTQHSAIPCRVYAPVGHYQELLPYLIRRLLENGANTSFINQLEDRAFDIEKIIEDPVIQLQQSPPAAAFLTLPKDLFGKQRINSAGINLPDLAVQSQVQQTLDRLKTQNWLASPLINGLPAEGKRHKISNPANPDETVGSVILSDPAMIEKAIDSAALAVKSWRLSTASERAGFLQNTADLLEKNKFELVSLCVREAGKTIQDALAEVREAVDFCRYYAQQSIRLFEQPINLPGPTGENNVLKQYGRGVFVCISPWNFPLAIFTGQITAALASGNCVLAKPASQTPLIAMRCIQLLHEAGIPNNVLHFLPGDGATVSQYLLTDRRISGVAFTGSSDTAQAINQRLAQRQDIIPLIAETGGQNVMIADNSAYSEQLIQDVVQSAFNSAGQRCSSLRVLFLPQETADTIIRRIIQVMQLLIIDDPEHIATDMGPLINPEAVKQLNQHVSAMQKQAKVLCQITLAGQQKNSRFFPPTLIELDSFSQLTEEHFGPILHVIRYDSAKLNTVIDEVNHCGYGLTLGIHSRIDHTIHTIFDNSKVGNIYINRNMISAVVGVQPFGGMGLSGTGPKAGGPHYLSRFAIEQTVTTNTTAIGGNMSLLTRKH